MKKSTLNLILISLTLISQYTSAARVTNVSKESFAQYGKENAYWVVTVTCDDESKHTVQRKTDQDTWCPKGNNDSCSDNKNVASENVCSDASLAKTKETKDQTQTAAAQQAREAQRVKDAQEKALVEQKIREAEQRIQQQIFLEESIASIQKQIQTLDGREQQIQQRLALINEIIRSDQEDNE